LTITIPKGTAGTADIVVTNPDGQSVTLPGGFTYTHLAPVIRSITPNTEQVALPTPTLPRSSGASRPIPIKSQAAHRLH
jgi:hypothetical protein